MADHGPFETEREASRTAAVRAVYAAFEADPGAGKMAPHNVAMLTSACEAAGVVLGAFDARQVEWLGTWEPHTCAVIAGLIVRAHEAGKASAMAGAETEWALSYIHRPNVPGLAARRVVEPYPDEARARKAVSDVREMRPEDEPKLMRRESSLWKEANETREGDN